MTGTLPGEHRSLRCLRVSVLALAGCVIIQAGLGFAGALRAAPLAIAVAVGAGLVVAGVRATKLRRHPPRPSGEPWSPGDRAGAAGVALALATRAWEGIHRETFTYDVLSYHLHLPTAWHDLGRLTIVGTPFGDQAPAYAPANAELFYELLIAATGNLRLAHAGQVPFAALATLAIYTAARVQGTRRSIGFGAALAFLLVPEVWQQATGAMSDLALASFVLAALPFLLELRPGLEVRARHAPGNVAALGATLGLALGTKYVGALLLLPVVGWAAAAIWRRRSNGQPREDLAAGAALTPLASTVVLLSAGFACGGFWYARNALVTGNPTFPVALRLGSLTLARGLYDGAAMRAWTYHLPILDFHPLLEMFSETTVGFLISGALGVLLSLRRKCFGWAGLAAAFLALCWLVVPYQQSRFLFVAWGVLTLAMASGARGLTDRFQAVLLVPAVVGGVLQAPTTARLLVALAWAAGVTLEGLRHQAGRRTPPATDVAPDVRRFPRSLAIAVLLVTGTGAGLAWGRAHPGDRSYVVGDAHDQGWTHVRLHLQGLRIAYTGSNLPLPLWGPSLSNRVRYVNIAGGPETRLHDFPGQATSAFPVSAEPAPERAHPDRDAWLSNLQATRIDVLFVAALYPEVRPSMSHDDAGFPIERAWADALPARFKLVFENAGVRIYKVMNGALSGGQPG